MANKEYQLWDGLFRKQRKGYECWDVLEELGEGIMLTNHSELKYYPSLMNQLERQFICKMADNLNAEVVLGTVHSSQRSSRLVRAQVEIDKAAKHSCVDDNNDCISKK